MNWEEAGHSISGNLSFSPGLADLIRYFEQVLGAPFSNFLFSCLCFQDSTQMSPPPGSLPSIPAWVKYPGKSHHAGKSLPCSYRGEFHCSTAIVSPLLEWIGEEVCHSLLSPQNVAQGLSYQRYVKYIKNLFFWEVCIPHKKEVRAVFIPKDRI